jgi:hypothetical protein
LNQDNAFLEERGQAFSVDGKMSSARRATIVTDFEDADPAVLSNARCLVEGVDIPLIDGVMFGSPKNSLIDIVQAVGRALRKPYGAPTEKVAAVVVPVVLESESSNIDVEAPEFDRLFSVVQALRDQDDVLAEEIDQLNLSVATGAYRRGSGALSGKIRLLIPGEVSLKELSEAITLRVAEVNSERAGTVSGTSQLGAGQRGSIRGRSLRTMGDYTPNKYRESLVDPTLYKFSSGTDTISKTTARINNNNIAHCLKVGVLKTAADQDFLALTKIGDSYKANRVSFIDLFKNQMMLYVDAVAGLYPYRALVEFHLRVENMDYWDFLYGIYPSDPAQSFDELIDSAEARTRAVRDLRINRALANKKNQEHINDLLSEATGIQYDSTNIWTDRTTIFNQFRYFRRHLELFDDIFYDDGNTFRFKPGGDLKARALLQRSEPSLISTYGDVWWLEK